MKNEILKYVAPAIILVIATIVAFFAHSPIILPQILAGFTILFGLYHTTKAIFKSITRSSPRTLAANIGRREFYGTLIILLGIGFEVFFQLNGRIDQLNGRIDQVMLQLMEISKKLSVP